MSTPTVNDMGDTITLDFHDEMIYAVLDRFRDGRDGTSAELTLRTTAPGVNPHLHFSRWSLSSLTARDLLVRMMKRRFPVNGVNWPDLVEDIARIGLEHHRAGEPVIMVGRMDRQPGPHYLIEPLVLRDRLNWLYGKGGTGKTTLGVAVALSVQERVPILGLSVPPEPVGTLLLDFETVPEDIDTIVKRLAIGADLRPVPELAYRRCVGALADQVDELHRIIVQKHIGFVVIDSAGAACGGEPESAEVTLRMTNAIRALGVTAQVIDHVPKDGDEPFGSVYKFNAARMVWRVLRQQESGEDEVRVGLFNTKANPTKKHRPLGWRLRFDDTTEAITFTRIDPADVEEFRSGLSAREQIRAYLLRAGAATAKGVTEGTGLNFNTVRETLKRMETRHQAVRLPREGEREVYYGVPV